MFRCVARCLPQLDRPTDDKQFGLRAHKVGRAIYNQPKMDHKMPRDPREINGDHLNILQICNTTTHTSPGGTFSISATTTFDLSRSVTRQRRVTRILSPSISLIIQLRMCYHKYIHYWTCTKHVPMHTHTCPKNVNNDPSRALCTSASSVTWVRGKR